MSKDRSNGVRFLRGGERQEGCDIVGKKGQGHTSALVKQLHGLGRNG